MYLVPKESEIHSLSFLIYFILFCPHVLFCPKAISIFCGQRQTVDGRAVVLSWGSPQPKPTSRISTLEPSQHLPCQHDTNTITEQKIRTLHAFSSSWQLGNSPLRSFVKRHAPIKHALFHIFTQQLKILSAVDLRCVSTNTYTTTSITQQQTATMSHLSELSIQLRKLQSENNAQSSEIDRLERQIRILSETKGISLNELRGALKTACEGEAHEELRAIVGKLEATLQGMEASGGGRNPRRGGFGNFGKGGLAEEENHVAAAARTQEQFNQEAAARARTTLELRVGELEELETTLRAELATLYQHVEKVTARNTFLETQNLQQKAQLAEWERRWRLKEEEEIKKGSVVPVHMPTSPTGGVSCGSYNYAEFATNKDAASEPPAPLIMLHNEPQSHLDNEQRVLAAETALAGEKQQRAILQSQMASAQKSYELKIDQYQHRMQFQAGQLTDLEQQLSSLYAAFGIVQNERIEERDQKEEWKKNLLESDTVLAKEAYEKEQQQMNNVAIGGVATNNVAGGTVPEVQYGQYGGRMTHKQSSRSFLGRSKSASVSSPGYPGSRRSLQSSPAPPMYTPPPAPTSLTAVKPSVDHTTIVKGYLWLLLDKNQGAPESTPTAASSHSSPFSPRKLLMKSKSNSKNTPSSSASPKYKKQMCVLHGANGLYQLRYGDSFLGPVAGVLEFITTGVSSTEHTPRSYNRNHGFEIMINAQDKDAPSLCCAAENDEDFMMWMMALMGVMDGSDSKQKSNIDETGSRQGESKNNESESALVLPPPESFLNGAASRQSSLVNAQSNTELE